MVSFLFLTSPRDLGHLHRLAITVSDPRGCTTFATINDSGCDISCSRPMWQRLLLTCSSLTLRQTLVLASHAVEHAHVVGLQLS